MSVDLTTDPILQIQAELKAAIQADPWFTGIPVLCSEPGILEKQIEEAIAKLGLLITIQPLEGEMSGTSQMDMDVGMTVTEMPLLNRSSSGLKKTGTQVVMNMMRIFSAMSASITVLDRWTLVNDNKGLLIYLLKGKVTAAISIS